MEKDIQIFECDCQSRDDMIVARLSNWEFKGKDFTELEKDLTIEFVTYLKDYNYYDNVFKRLFWRIKNSLKILFIGEIRTVGYFMPCRTSNSEEDIEKIFGYQTTKDLAKWIDSKADEIKEFYENKILKEK